MKLYSNPEKDFNERDDLEPNDFNHITNVYETEKDSVKIFVALGQKKESSDDLVYYPIYLILKTKQVKKIGIIEGDFTIDWQSKQIKLQPNYFTFVTKAYLTHVALSNLNELESEITALHEAHASAQEIGDYTFKVLPAMLEVRKTVDALEGLLPDEQWPLPTYQEMLFIR